MLSRLGQKITHGIQARFHRHVLDAGYDRRNGIETNGVHLPQNLFLTGKHARHAHEYLATPTAVFKRMLHALPGDYRRFVFIDLGSGKGRMLLMAAELPFRRIEGIELSEELHRIAVNNVTKADRGSNIVVHHMDAAEYEFPPEPLVIYLFHPFEGSSRGCCKIFSSRFAAGPAKGTFFI